MYIYKHIKRIIDEADIQGLLKMGAPEHEYDHESKQICYRLNSEDASSLDDIFSVVFWVFLQSFSSVIKFSDGEIMGGLPLTSPPNKNIKRFTPFPSNTRPITSFTKLRLSIR